MNYFIKVLEDTWSSYPSEKLSIELSSEKITLSLTGDASKHLNFNSNLFKSEIKKLAISDGKIAIDVMESSWSEDDAENICFEAYGDSVYFKVNEFDDEDERGYNEREIKVNRVEFLALFNSSSEAEIIINGVQVSDGMAMTMRVAIESFASSLHENGLGDDEMGEKLTKGYLSNIELIRRVMI